MTGREAECVRKYWKELYSKQNVQKNMIAQEENYTEENESYSTDKECLYKLSGLSK